MPMTFGSNKRVDNVDVQSQPADTEATSEQRVDEAVEPATVGDQPEPATPELLDDFNWMSPFEDGAVIIHSHKGPHVILPGGLPEAINRLYEAAEQPPPIVLDAPRDPQFTVGQVISVGVLKVAEDHALVIRIGGNNDDGYREIGSTRMDADRLLYLATEIATLALWLKNGPDPAQIAPARNLLIANGVESDLANRVAYELVRAGYSLKEPQP